MSSRWRKGESQLTGNPDDCPHGRNSLALLDTAPHSQADPLAAAQAADVILIPCRPGILDLRAIGATVQIARLANKPSVVVLDACPAQRGGLANEAAEAVRGYGAEVAPFRLAQRAAFAHALARGLTAQEYEPDGKAAREIRQLYKWTCQFVGMPASPPVSNDQKSKPRRRTA